MESPFKLDWANHAQAKYACEHYHYSKILPTGKLVKIGVYENGHFVGAVIFSRGASPFIGRIYNLEKNEICELTRVALSEHKTSVTRILSIAIKMLKKCCPKIKLIISFADPGHDHKGKIYQAGNWIYTGTSNPVKEYQINGRWRHVRGAYHHPDRPYAHQRIRPGKYRYLMPLEKDLEKALKAQALPYPKDSAQVVQKGGQPANQPEDGGSIPTLAHQAPIAEAKGETP